MVTRRCGDREGSFFHFSAPPRDLLSINAQRKPAADAGRQRRRAHLMPPEMVIARSEHHQEGDLAALAAANDVAFPPVRARTGRQPRTVLGYRDIATPKIGEGLRQLRRCFGQAGGCRSRARRLWNDKRRCTGQVLDTHERLVILNLARRFRIASTPAELATEMHRAATTNWLRSSSSHSFLGGRETPSVNTPASKGLFSIR
jgi:hypothetical protein